MKSIMSKLAFRLHLLYQLFRPDLFHKPGEVDVTGITMGMPFSARPNFYYLNSGHPSRLPLYSKPEIGDKSWCVSGDWPCEFRRKHRRNRGPYCYTPTFQDGDWVEVVGQVIGQTIKNQAGHSSDIWDVLKVPVQYITANQHLLPHPVGGYHYVFAPDLWLGNTGWHHLLPYSPHS